MVLLCYYERRIVFLMSGVSIQFSVHGKYVATCKKVLQNFVFFFMKKEVSAW